MKLINPLVIILVLMTGCNTHATAQSLSGSLPVVLVDFNASLTADNKVSISWTTQQEINIGSFTIEKSNDGVDWSAISSVKSSGNTSLPVTYNQLDAFPLKGPNYYRLCIRNMNGLSGFTITKYVKVILGRSIVIYPNPSADIVNISLSEIPQEDWNVSLIDNSGKLIFQKKFNRKITTASMGVGQHPSGSYILKINYDGMNENKRLVINHH